MFLANAITQCKSIIFCRPTIVLTANCQYILCFIYTRYDCVVICRRKLIFFHVYSGSDVFIIQVSLLILELVFPSLESLRFPMNQNFRTLHINFEINAEILF